MIQAIQDLQGKMITHLLILILILCTPSAVHLLHSRGRVYWSHPGKNPGAVDRLMQTHTQFSIVKLRQGSGKDWQGMAVKAKGVKALTLA